MVGNLTSTVEVSKMASVKENKLYQQLSGMKNLDGRGLIGTWKKVRQTRQHGRIP